MSTTADLNDYSSRVNITGVTIASIPIDIVAQTIGNIAIDIAAASMGAIAISINVADIVGNLPIDIVAQTIGNVSIDIAAQTLGNIGIDIAANSFGNLPIDIVAQTIGNIGISLNANTAGNITVDIAAQTMVGNLTIDIAANSFGNLPIDIVAQTIGNIGIDLAANTLGNLTVDIAAQTIGNIAIDVAAQTVDLNIKTSGGVNIIIDKLTQSAYTERRSTLSNDNGVTTPTAPPASELATPYRGKFFPRGCRGHLTSISVYCKRTAAGTITIKASPHPSMGEILSETITLGAAWDWKSAAINRFWNYDSLFIWYSAVGADVSIGYEIATPYDDYFSADAGVTWQQSGARRFIRASYIGETVGDIPVSGTLNTIEIPSATTGADSGTILVPSGVETSLLVIDGAGEVTRCSFNVAHDGVQMRFYVDGVLIDPLSILSGLLFNAFNLNASGHTATTPQIQLLTYAAGAACIFATQIPFKFRRSFEIRADQTTGVNQNAVAGVLANLIG